jgi:outer membrane protein assembly factor BamB
MRTRTGLGTLAALVGLCSLLVVAGTGPGGAAEPGGPWPVVQHDRQHTGRSEVAGPKKYATERCTADLTGSEMGAPVVGSDGTIYVASGGSADSSSDWRLHALNPDCSPAWSFRLPGWPGRTVPAIGADGTVYIHTNGTQNIAGPPHLVAVHPDGTAAWDLPYFGELAVLATTTPSSPAVATDGTIWFGSTNTWLYAVEPGGAIACATQSPTVSSITASPAIAADGTVYVLDVTNELMAVDQSCGLEWSLGLQPVTAATDSTVAIGTGETVYAAANEDLVAVSSAGTERWRVDLGEQASTPALAADGTVYVESEGLAAVSPDGDVLWSGRSCLGWTASSGGQDDPPVIGADGLVYHQQSSAQNVVCAFRPDGTRVWSLVREFGTAGGRLAITGDGALLNAEGGFTTPTQLGIIEPAARADARIRRGTQQLLGNDIVNTTGSRQSATGSARPGHSVTYTVSVQNDAQFADRLTLRGQGSAPAFRVTYRTPSGTDVTSAVTAGTYRTASLGAGDTQTLKATVTVRRAASTDARLSRTLTASSVADPTRRDTVRFVTRRT